MKIVKIIISFVFICFSNQAFINAQIKISPFISYGVQSMKYSYDNENTKGNMGIGFGADLQYHLSEYMIIGTGVRIHTYGATTSFDQFYAEQEMVDTDGDSYILKTTGTNIKEEYKSTAIEIPIFFRYQKWINSDMILYGATGPVISFLSNPKTTMSGTLNTEGYYSSWNLTIDDVEEYGFYSRDVDESKTDTQLKTSLGWLFEIGTEYYFSKRLNLALGVFFQPGLTNISNGGTDSSLMTDAFSYNGTLNGAEKVNLSKIGLRVGVNFDLTPNYRSSVKSIR